MPNAIASIGRGAFSRCTALVSVKFPSALKSIGDGAFRGCTALTSFDIPNSVKTIGEKAFASCFSFDSVTIPKSVTRIGNKVFADCRNLKTVINLSRIPQKIHVSTFAQYGTLHVAKGCKAAYENAECWKDFWIVDDMM
jgi:hypothetical protein